MSDDQVEAVARAERAERILNRIRDEGLGGTSVLSEMLPLLVAEERAGRAMERARADATHAAVAALSAAIETYLRSVGHEVPCNSPEDCEYVVLTAVLADVPAAGRALLETAQSADSMLALCEEASRLTEKTAGESIPEAVARIAGERDAAQASVAALAEAAGNLLRAEERPQWSEKQAADAAEAMSALRRVLADVPAAGKEWMQRLERAEGVEDRLRSDLGALVSAGHGATAADALANVLALRAEVVRLTAREATLLDIQTSILERVDAGIDREHDVLADNARLRVTLEETADRWLDRATALSACDAATRVGMGTVKAATEPHGQTARVENRRGVMRFEVQPLDQKRAYVVEAKATIEVCGETVSATLARGGFAHPEDASAFAEKMNAAIKASNLAEAGESLVLAGRQQ